MAKKKVYLETSVISYLTARQSLKPLNRARQEWTRRWWEEKRSEYDLYVSDSVIAEIRRGDPDAARRRMDAVAGLPVLVTTDVINRFHVHLFDTKILPEKARVDAMHIAIAAGHGIPYLATWNCAHINNDTTREKILDEIRLAGYNEVVMATPEELWRVPQ
jgi:predicted nucleic acid-binding protein